MDRVSARRGGPEARAASAQDAPQRLRLTGLAQVAARPARTTTQWRPRTVAGKGTEAERGDTLSQSCPRVFFCPEIPPRPIAPNSPGATPRQTPHAPKKREFTLQPAVGEQKTAAGKAAAAAQAFSPRQAAPAAPPWDHETQKNVSPGRGARTPCTKSRWSQFATTSNVYGRNLRPETTTRSLRSQIATSNRSHDPTRNRVFEVTNCHLKRQLIAEGFKIAICDLEESPAT
jgi:hypothetical protein